MTVFQIILLIIAAVTVAAVITAMISTEKARNKVSYMLDALEDKELNFRFDERRFFGRRFNKTLNRLRNIFDKERREIMEQEQYYGLMLDHVRTGIVVTEPDGRVNYYNTTALHLLGIATFSHIRQLRTSLYEAFAKVTGSDEERASYYNESGKKTISLTASEATIGGKRVKVIAFNDISDEMAANEQESWSKLIRVLTHEIMNTVTPIASLSETLSSYMSDKDADSDVLAGLETISQSSRGLIKFVESYRNLTRVAAPVKKAFYVREMIDRVLQLTSQQTSEAGAVCTYTEKSNDILLYADESQISQIIINLVKNACQAGAHKIEITAEIDLSDSVFIHVSNNGRPISKESREEIFVPFYTTKQEGTGIGLSLSRQIMRLHNGTLTLSGSDEKATVFTLFFR